MNPKVTEEEFIGLMTKCNVGQLTDDQRFALQALFATSKDGAGQAPALSILAAIGLPSQTLGAARQGKGAPKMILSEAMRKQAQGIIIKLRQQLDLGKLQPA